MLLVLLRCGDVELNPGPEVSNLSLWSSNVRILNLLMIDCILTDVASKFDILCICETFLNLTSTVDLNIPGYLPITRKDRAGVGGGIALYVANYCAVKILIHFELPDLESLWAEVKTHTSAFAVCVCYRPPNNNTQFWGDLQESI